MTSVTRPDFLIDTGGWYTTYTSKWRALVPGSSSSMCLKHGYVSMFPNEVDRHHRLCRAALAHA